MKNYPVILSILILLMGIGTRAQEASIRLDGKTISGKKFIEDVWIFEDAQDSIVAISKSIYNDLVKKLRTLQQDSLRLAHIIQAKNELISAFENYESTASAHISKQDSLIMTADTLYQGYKQLYRDLKSLNNINTFALIPGVGFVWKPEPQVVGSFGVAYDNVQGHFQFGKDYQGLILGYRLGF